MAAPAGNPADLTSEPIPHRITSCLGLRGSDCSHAVWGQWSPPLPRKGRSVGNSTLRLGTAYSHLPPRDGCVRMPPGSADRRRTAPVWRHARPTALMSTEHAGAILYQGFFIATGHSVHSIWPGRGAESSGEPHHHRDPRVLIYAQICKANLRISLYSALHTRL
jgi:hypothetical protein